MVIKELPNAHSALGAESIFDIYEPQLNWLVAWWNDVEKEREKQYKKMRKK